MQKRSAYCHGEDCKKLKKKHINLTMTKEGGKYYCDPCLVKFRRRKVQMKDLYHFIARERNITYPTGFMLAQIKRLTDIGYTYFGIHQSLIYMMEVKKKQLNNETFISYVPYVYEDAKQWYIEQATIRKEQKKRQATKKEPTKINFNYHSNSANQKDLISADGLLD